MLRLYKWSENLQSVSVLTFNIFLWCSVPGISEVCGVFWFTFPGYFVEPHWFSTRLFFHESLSLINMMIFDVFEQVEPHAGVMQHCSVDCSSHSDWLRPVISALCWYCCTISNDLLILLTVVSTFKLLSVSRQSSQIMRTVNSVSTYSAAYFLLLYRSTCDIFTAGNYLPSVAISLCSAELHAVGISVILHAPVAGSLPQVLKYKLANKNWLLSINRKICRPGWTLWIAVKASFNHCYLLFSSQQLSFSIQGFKVKQAVKLFKTRNILSAPVFPHWNIDCMTQPGSDTHQTWIWSIPIIISSGVSQ